MKNKLAVLSISFCSLAFQQAHAEQQGMVSPHDNRIHLFTYNPDDVYAINTHIGKAALIQLENGEHLDEESGAVGMGDGESWSLVARSNNIIFKPIKEQPETNIILVSNRRTYAFELHNNPMLPPTYIARFAYPEEKNTQEQQSKVKPAAMRSVGKSADGKVIMIDAKYNMDYLYRGNSEIKPTNAWNDGRFTYLQYNHAGDLPAVYRVLSDNSEMLVNTHIEKDTLVLQEISPLYRVRFGKLVGDIANNNIKTPVFNEDGTSDSGFVRADY